jgi:hypothetical protein
MSLSGYDLALLGVWLVFAGLLFYELKSGKIYGRGGEAWTREKQPGWYWFGTTCQFALLVALFIWWWLHRPLQA